jgi:hypothetical protein
MMRKKGVCLNEFFLDDEERKIIKRKKIANGFYLHCSLYHGIKK